MKNLVIQFHTTVSTNIELVFLNTNNLFTFDLFCFIKIMNKTLD